MKNKFVLTEEESKRILSLHKEKIDQEREVVSEMTNKSDEILLEAKDAVKINYKNSTATLTKKLYLTKTVYGTNKLDYNVQKTIIAGAVFKPTNKGNLVADAIIEDPETGKTRKRTIYYYCWPNKLRKDENTVPKIGVGDLFYMPGGSLASGTQREIGDFDRLCEHLKYGNKEDKTPTPTPSKKGCPSIIKSFTDAGYTQITVERYRELANDKTRIRKYKFCPVTKKNLYFAKPQVTQTGPAPTPVPDGGETNTGGGGQTYPFDYDTILKAFPPDEIINPFEQGGEEEVQSTIVTDKMYAEF